MSIQSDCSNGTKHVAAKESLQKQLTGNMRGVCCKVLDNSLRELLSLEDEAEAANAASEILSIVYVDEIKKIKERLQVTIFYPLITVDHKCHSYGTVGSTTSIS